MELNQHSNHQGFKQGYGVNTKNEVNYWLVMNSFIPNMHLIQFLDELVEIYKIIQF